MSHLSEMSNITTRANNQFPRPDFHRLDKQPYRLQPFVKGEFFRNYQCRVPFENDLDPPLLREHQTESGAKSSSTLPWLSANESRWTPTLSSSVR